MSEKVIINPDNRETKELKLPGSGVTVILYPSLLLNELEGIDSKEVKNGDIGTVSLMFSKMIKSWNAYAPDTETPMEITPKIVGEVLQTKDVEVLTAFIVDIQGKKN